jgi:hypothetical protein
VLAPGTFETARPFGAGNPLAPIDVPSKVDAWHGALAVGGLKLPNYLVLLSAAAVAALAWLKALSVWKAPLALPLVIAALSLFHVGDWFVLLMGSSYPWHASPDVGLFLTAFGFIGILVILVRRSVSDDPSSERPGRGLGASVAEHPVLWSVAIVLTLPLIGALVVISSVALGPATNDGLGLSFPAGIVAIGGLALAPFAFLAWAYLWRAWHREGAKGRARPSRPQFDDRRRSFARQHHRICRSPGDNRWRCQLSRGCRFTVSCSHDVSLARCRNPRARQVAGDCSFACGHPRLRGSLRRHAVCDRCAEQRHCRLYACAEQGHGRPYVEQ